MVRISKNLKETKQIANAFSNFFVNADNTVNKDIPLTFKSPNDYLKIPTPNHYFYIQSQNLKLRTLLTLLNYSKASGPSIPTKLLKLLRSVVSDPISLLINDSFLRGQFLD